MCQKGVSFKCELCNLIIFFAILFIHNYDKFDILTVTTTTKCGGDDEKKNMKKETFAFCIKLVNKLRIIAFNIY